MLDGQEALVEGLVERPRPTPAAGPSRAYSVRAMASSVGSSPARNAWRSNGCGAATSARHSSRAGVVTSDSGARRADGVAMSAGVREQELQEDRLGRLERPLDGAGIEGSGAGKDGIEADARSPA